MGLLAKGLGLVAVLALFALVLVPVPPVKIAAGLAALVFGGAALLLR